MSSQADTIVRAAKEPGDAEIQHCRVASQRSRQFGGASIDA